MVISDGTASPLYAHGHMYNKTIKLFATKFGKTCILSGLENSQCMQQ